jgi:hypothetical protein
MDIPRIFNIAERAHRGVWGQGVWGQRLMTRAIMAKGDSAHPKVIGLDSRTAGIGSDP